MWSHHGKKSRQINTSMHLHWLHPNPCLKVRDFRFPGWSPTFVCFSSGFSFFRPPNAPTPTPKRWCQVDAISDHLLKSRWFSDFYHSESSEGWWLKVDGTWYFRITKITLFCLVALLRSKTLAAGIVARCGKIGGSPLPWRFFFLIHCCCMLLPYGTEFTGVPWELNLQ